MLKSCGHWGPILVGEVSELVVSVAAGRGRGDGGLLWASGFLPAGRGSTLRGWVPRVLFTFSRDEMSQIIAQL